MHQNYLRSFKPEKLQPIDEDVDVRVLQQFADAVGGEVVYFTYKSIWSKDDYLYAVITNHATYGLPIKKSNKVHVLDKSKRLSMLKKKNIELPSLEQYRLHSYLKLRNFFKKRSKP